jgi:hypothetical protein
MHVIILIKLKILFRLFQCRISVKVLKFNDKPSEAIRRGFSPVFNNVNKSKRNKGFGNEIISTSKVNKENMWKKIRD